MIIDDRLKDLKQAVDGLVPTRNQKGFMMTELSHVSKEYVKYAKQCHEVLEIGCAYGITVLPVLDYLKTHVYVVDLCAEHIDILNSKLKPEQFPYFTSEIAEFPVQTDFTANRFDAIHISNVLHFISAEHFMYALYQCFNWLKPEGKLFISMCSLYFPYFVDFVPIYEERKQKGYLFAGEIDDMRVYTPEHIPQSIRE